MDWKQKYYEELYHHGIKGQKWGRRRYQNQDGSLTPAGEKRYGVGDGDSDSSSSKKSLREKMSDIANRQRERKLATEARKIAADEGDWEALEVIQKRIKEMDDAMGIDSSPDAAKKYKDSLKKTADNNTQETGLVPVSKKSSNDNDTQETGLVPVSKKSKNTADDVEDIGELKVDLDDVTKPSNGKNDTSDSTSAKKIKILEADSDQYTIDDTPGQKRKDAKEAARRERQEEAEKAREAKKREKEAEKNKKEEEAEKKKNEKEREEAKRKKEREEAEKERKAKEREKEAEKNKKEEEAEKKKNEKEREEAKRKKAREEGNDDDNSPPPSPPSPPPIDPPKNRRKINVDKTLGAMKNVAGDVDKASQGLGRLVDVAERARKQKAVRNSDAYMYSNAELDAKIARMQKEATYNDWKYNKQTSRGAERAKNVLDTIGAVAVTAGAIAGTALTIRKLLK